MTALPVKKLACWKDKAVGMIGRDSPQNVMFFTRLGVHTFGLKFPIDVLILDGDSRVVEIREELPVNRLFLWNPLYAVVIELPRGAIKSNNLKIGEKVDLRIINP